jgi:hypothetical protein
MTIKEFFQGFGGPLFLVMIGCLLILSACGKVKAGQGARAERVFTDQAGYTCFIVYNDDGEGVGGNCLKE